MTILESVPERLAHNIYETDETKSHIEIDQDVCRATGADDLLVRICPAHVYRRAEDGTVSAEYAACLECGTCLALAPTGAIRWHYPRSGMGIVFREG